MKTAIVPAQITTVEDKVTGNLSLSQLLLLAAPVFIGSAVYIVLPPSLGVAAYKLVIVGIIGLVFGLLAIRVKGRILLFWVITIARYNLRPRYYVFDKNDMHLRQVAKDIEAPEPDHHVDESDPRRPPLPALSLSDSVVLERIIASPKAKLHFKTDRKGGLNVHITEVE